MSRGPNYHVTDGDWRMLSIIIADLSSRILDTDSSFSDFPTSGAALTDNALVRGDGGAEGIQTSGVLLDDSDNLSGIGTIGCTSLTASGTVQGGTLTDGTATLTGGLLGGLTAVSSVNFLTADITYTANKVVIADSSGTAFIIEQLAGGAAAIYMQIDTTTPRITFGNGTDNPEIIFETAGLMTVGGDILLAGGGDIGVTGHTDLLTLASGTLTVDGDLNMAGTLTNTVPAVSQRGINIDGDTNPYNNFSSATTSFNRITRVATDTVTSIPSLFQGNLLSTVLNLTRTSGVAGAYSGKTLAGVGGSLTLGETLSFGVGTWNGTDYIGSLNALSYNSSVTSTGAGNHSFSAIGGDFISTNNGQFTMTSGSITGDFIGGRFESKETTSSLTGTGVFNYVGGDFVATGETAVSTTSTSIAGRFSATGSDTNIAIQVDAGSSTLLDTLITAPAAGTVPLTIKAAASQTANLLNITNSADTELLQVLSTGHLFNTDGMRTIAAQYGPAFWSHVYGEGLPEHTNGTGSYDHIDGAAEKLFTKSDGDDFTQADADNGNWILLTGTNLGAVAEIKEFIDADNVVVGGFGWDGDLASQTFHVYKHPVFVTGNGGNTEFSTGSDGEFEVHSYGFTGSKMIEFKNRVAADSSDTMHIEHINNGYANCDAIQLFYETGDLQAVDANQVIQVSVDETGATGGDLDLLYLETTDVSAVNKHAIHVGTGFAKALTVSGASADDPDYGYELSTGGTVATQRVNAGAGADNAFLEAGTDVTIFDAVNDWIIIGNDATFEVLEVILTTPSSKDCELEFYYTSDGAGTWSVLPGVDDGTQGFTKSGLIDWTAPVGWAEDDETDDGDVITEGYYIGIKRTYAPNIPTEPVEDYFKIYLEQGGDTGMTIFGDGVVKLPVLTGVPAAPENGMMWMEADGLHIYYGGAEKLVAGV